MNLSRTLSRVLFRMLSSLGRPFGGLRPRRLHHILARRAFAAFREQDFGWYRDRWGSELRLNPYYLIDRDIIALGVYDAGLHAVIEQRVRPGDVCLDLGDLVCQSQYPVWTLDVLLSAVQFVAYLHQFLFRELYRLFLMRGWKMPCPVCGRSRARTSGSSAAVCCSGACSMRAW